MNDKLWLERLQGHDPTKSGFLFGRDHPDQAVLTPSFKLPPNYDYMAKWRAHLMLSRKGDPDDGLNETEINILMNSEDTARTVTVTLFGKEYHYAAQYNKFTRIVKRLQAIGLTYIIEYLGGNILDPADGMPLGLKGCVWAWTPIGLKWVRVRLGIIDEAYTPKLLLEPIIVDVNKYG
jgi:hypothetical protein